LKVLAAGEWSQGRKFGGSAPDWAFAGSDAGGHRAAVFNSLIVTARLNDIDPQAWLADVLARIADHPARRIDRLPLWNWKNTNR